MIISNKDEMYKLLRAGRLGNTLQSWSSLAEMFQTSKHRGLVAIRSMVPGGRFTFGIKAGCVHKVIHAHYKNVPYNLSPIIPNSSILLQAELLNDTLRYSTEKNHFRKAMEKSRYTENALVTRTILRHYLDQPSLENIERLQEEYPDHVIEFAVTSKPYGMYKLNTIIWEVRLY